MSMSPLELRSGIITTLRLGIGQLRCPYLFIPPSKTMTDSKLFDHYSFRARLQPAFLALVPLALGAFAWAQPGAKWLTAIWSLLGAAGFTFFLANVARNRGKSIEPKLWESWGGTPTTQLLRHSGPGNSNLRERWHKQLSKLLGKPFPTPEEERN